MRWQLLIGLLVTALLALTMLPLADARAPKKDAPVDYSEVARAGLGVCNVVRDKHGRILSVLVIGRARISTVLGAAKGKEIAARRASLVADAEFLKWLGSKVEVHEKVQDQATLFLVGVQDNDQDALRESGKATDTDSTQYKRTAQGVVRGLQIVYREVNGKNRELTLVKKWNASTAQAIDHLGNKDRQPTPARKPARQRPDKVLKDEKVTIRE